MKFILSKENIELAAAEVLALVKVSGYSLEGNVLEIENDIEGLDKRLALTKEIIINDKKIIISKKGFMDRRAHLLPEGHPASTTPKLARAMVNLTGAEMGESILDPFCGAGGILIEAGLMGMKVAGSDIDEIMVRRARINLEHLGIKEFKLDKKDAVKVDYGADYIVTDLPYGKNTKITDELELLYLNFLKRIESKAIVGFPDFIDYKKLIIESGLKIEKEFTWYLHKTLSKKIILIYAENP